MKAIVGIVCMLLFGIIAKAQWFQLTKQRNIGVGGIIGGLVAGPYYTHNQIHRLPNGNLCLTTTASQDTLYDKTVWGYGDNDGWYLEIDSEFNSVKQWIIGGDTTDILSDFILTSDTCMLSLFISNSDSSFDKSQNNKGDNDYWIVKTDMNGNKLWDITLGSQYEDVPSRIYETSDSTYLVLGNSRTEFPSGDVSDSAQADAPWFVILDKNGNLKNEYRINPAASWPYALTFLPFGLYSVHFYGVQGGVWGSVGTHGSLILESDTAVFANWTNLFDAWGSGIGGCFYDSKTDNNYLGTTLFIQDTNSICSEVSRGGFDGVVYKTDWLGNVLWTKLYGNNCRDNLAGVFDYNDTLLLAYGYTQSAAGNEISHTIHDYNANCAASGADLWLLLINKNNPFQYCDTIFGGNRLDICGFNSLSRYDDTTFYWVSSSSSDSSFEKTSHKIDTASTSKELWLLKMIISPYALSGLGWQTAEATAPPTVFPNPTNNMLHVSFDTKGTYKLTIQNMQGAIVYSGIFSPGACSVYIGHLAPATYTYTVSTLEGTSFYGKVIKY